LNIAGGIFFGAVGGFFSALFGFGGAFVNAIILRTKMHVAFKILLCILTVIVAFAAWAGIVVLVASVL